MPIISRAFAVTTGVVPTGFTQPNAGKLIYETEPGDADTGLTNGPEGYTYWGGPDEGSGITWLIAYTDGATDTHTGANSVASKIGFWSATGDSAFIALANNISNQGLTSFSPATFGSAGAALGTMNDVPGMHVFSL